MKHLSAFRILPILLAISLPCSLQAEVSVARDGSSLTVGTGGSKSAEGSFSSQTTDGSRTTEVHGKSNAEVSARQTFTMGKNGAEYNADLGVKTETSVGGGTQIGSDENNVHASADATISAEMAARIKARLKADQDGIRANAEGKVGASVSAEGTIKGGVTLWGIPLDVKLTGAVKAGAEASGKAGIQYDAKTGKVTMVLEGSAVLGVGAKGGIEVELGVGEACRKALDAAYKLANSPFAQSVVDKVQDTMSSLFSAEEAANVGEILDEIGEFVGKEAEKIPDRLVDRLVQALPEGPARDAARQMAEKIRQGGIANLSAEDLLSIGTGAVQGKMSELLVSSGIDSQTANAIAQNTANGLLGTLTGKGGTINPGAIATTIRNTVGQVVKSTIAKTLGQDAANKWEQAWTDFKAGNNPWSTGSLQAALKQTAVVLVDKAIDKLGDMAWKRIEQLAKKYPAVAEVMKALGIGKEGLIATAKNIWGVLTGPGSLAEKFKTLAWDAAQGLAKMAKNLLNWLGGKVAAWINAQIGQLINKIWTRIVGWLQKWLGGKINYGKIYAALTSKLGEWINKGIGKIISPIAIKVEPVITNTAHQVIYGNASATTP